MWRYFSYIVTLNKPNLFYVSVICVWNHLFCSLWWLMVSCVCLRRWSGGWWISWRRRTNRSCCRRAVRCVWSSTEDSRRRMELHLSVWRWWVKTAPHENWTSARRWTPRTWRTPTDITEHLRFSVCLVMNRSRTHQIIDRHVKMTYTVFVMLNSTSALTLVTLITHINHSSFMMFVIMKISITLPERWSRVQTYRCVYLWKLKYIRESLWRMWSHVFTGRTCSSKCIRKFGLKC